MEKGPKTENTLILLFFVYHAQGIRCTDRDTRCPGWASQGRCETDSWVYRNCWFSCKRTDICDEQQPRPSGIICFYFNCICFPFVLDDFSFSSSSLGSCSEPFGLGWDRTLPDSAFQASSSFHPGKILRSELNSCAMERRSLEMSSYQALSHLLCISLSGGPWVASASNARLYMRDDHDEKRIGSWCAAYGQTVNQWLQVDLGQVKYVSAVATQGNLSIRLFPSFCNQSFYDRGIYRARS